jgi:hypothetical protein
LFTAVMLMLEKRVLRWLRGWRGATE